MRGIRKIIRFETAYAGQELFLVVGFFMVLAAFAKLVGLVNFSSDWFWFIAGLGLVIEGMIMIVKQRKFNRKYMIIEKKQ